MFFLEICDFFKNFLYFFCYEVINNNVFCNYEICF